MGTPKPTAIMPKTSGEMKSMGGEPDPTNNVLQEIQEEEFIWSSLTSDKTVQIKHTS